MLTSAHCLKDKNVTSVRLSEFDSTIALKDDTSDSYSVEIEETIVHESYDDSSQRNHDIALLRLARDVQLTNWVSPVCLPRVNEVDQRLTVLGQGNNNGSSVITQREMPVVNTTKCNEIYGIVVEVSSSSSRICVEPHLDHDTCRGDSGGPLMSLDSMTKRWSAVGLFSHGPSPCDKAAGWPAVYTKVADYVPWILSKLRA